MARPRKYTRTGFTSSCKGLPAAAAAIASTYITRMSVLLSITSRLKLVAIAELRKAETACANIMQRESSGLNQVAFTTDELIRWWYLCEDSIAIGSKPLSQIDGWIHLLCFLAYEYTSLRLVLPTEA